MEMDRFSPSLAGALSVRAAIQARLTESLSHVFERCEGHVEFDARRAAALLRRTASGERLPPAVFGRYFALVETIEKGSLEQVREALASLLAYAEGAPAPGLRLRAFTRRGFTVEEEAELRRDFAAEPLVNAELAHLDAAAEEETLAQCARVLDMMRSHAPLTFVEIETLVSELIVAKSASFAGCSSLERWGSVLVNAGAKRSDLALCETIAHECAHNALFAMAPVNFHVTNDPGERYSSPLRGDPRPMDGVYHATFVLARVCFAMNEIAASPTAEPALRDEARAIAASSAKGFASGYAVVNAHAAYTDEGRAIMESAARYVAAAGQAAVS